MVSWSHNCYLVSFYESLILNFTHKLHSLLFKLTWATVLYGSRGHLYGHLYGSRGHFTTLITVILLIYLWFLEVITVSLFPSMKVLFRILHTSCILYYLNWLLWILFECYYSWFTHCRILWFPYAVKPCIVLSFWDRFHLWRCISIWRLFCFYSWWVYIVQKWVGFTVLWTKLLLFYFLLISLSFY